MDPNAVLAIIYEGHERPTVDYKRCMPWQGESRFALIKSIIAFANAGGGYIVIGIDEKESDSEKRYTGVDVIARKTWDPTNVNRDINNYCGPSLDVDVQEILDSEKGVTFVVLRVPSHGVQPHLCTQDKNDSKGNLILRRAAIYYRTRDRTCEEIREVTDMRELLRRSTLAMKDELLAEFQQIIDGTTRRYSESTSPKFDQLKEMDAFAEHADTLIAEYATKLMFREVLCHPTDVLLECSVEDAKVALADACVDYTGWPFLFYLPSDPWPPTFGENSIHACQNQYIFRFPTFDYWKFDYARGLFYAKNATWESGNGHPKSIDPQSQSESFAEIIISQGRLFHKLGLTLDQQLTLVVRFSPVTGARIERVFGSFINRMGSQPFADPIVTEAIREPLFRFLNSPADVAGTLMEKLSRKMGYSGELSAAHLAEKAAKRLERAQK